MALEQLSFLFSGRGWAGEGECRLDGDFVSGSSCIKPSLQALWRPPFAQNAKDGAPTRLVMPARSKAWATRPTHYTLGPMILAGEGATWNNMLNNVQSYCAASTGK